MAAEGVAPPKSQGLRLLQFKRLCETGSPAEQAVRIQEARGLFQDAYDALDNRFAAPIDDEQLEALLHARGYLCAALRLVPDNARIMLFRTSSDKHHATIGLHGAPRDVTAAADTFALALLAAHSCALADACAHLLGDG